MLMAAIIIRRVTGSCDVCSLGAGANEIRRGAEREEGGRAVRGQAGEIALSISLFAKGNRGCPTASV